ncbi:adenosine receptor A2b [Callorhinchus milii]|uniref:Adenosine A2b receptor n=1 Tax=Callorhinchus milii TaxID=7868 RepID=A0A4W3IS21_CALMI|nr:adenosine receptor A2b [Callorhinchus milii]|eukprot:gi/632957770/ref/XP_007894666.1/ PREDICTED: adenosine receptor A2b [Callorhinchus milii]
MEMGPNPLYITVEVLIAVLAILGNVLVCWAVSINTNLKTATNYFLVSLAVADIAVGLFAIPFAIVISIGLPTDFHGCLFLVSFVLVQTQSSIFSLLAVAIDRYLAIKVHLRYKGLVTGRRAKLIIAVFWILSFVIGLIPLFGWSGSKECLNKTNPVTPTDNGSCQVQCLFLNVIDMGYMVYFNFFGCVLTPLIIMLVIYLKIFTVVRKQLRQIEHSSINSDTSRTFLQKQLNAAKSLSIIVGFFAFCWLPLHILNCINLLHNDYFRTLHHNFMDVAIVLSHAHSVGNPVIYASRIQEFRKTFHQIITKHILRGRDKVLKSDRSNTQDTYLQATSLLT